MLYVLKKNHACSIDRVSLSSREHAGFRHPAFILFNARLIAGSLSLNVAFILLYQVGNSLSGGRIVVSKVADGGPASKSNGLKAQDVILKVWFENEPNFTRIRKVFLARVDEKYARLLSSMA